MPDNTWFNPYKLWSLKCLSSGPSQGIVFELDDQCVIKVPFQYPVGEGSTKEDQIDHLIMSLRSFQCFKQESRIYDLLLSNHNHNHNHSHSHSHSSPHPNILTRFKCKQVDCLVLEKIQPVREAWKTSTDRVRAMWMMELLNVVCFLEDLGYLHGDMTIVNIGIDKDNHLKLFDFGSAVHCQDEEYQYQIRDDQFTLATCIYFLATGKDPFEQADTTASVKSIRKSLQQGTFDLAPAAKKFQHVLQGCWSQKESWSFKELKTMVSDILGEQMEVYPTPTPTPPFPATTNQLSGSSVSTSVSLEEFPREEAWLNEEQYRNAWTKLGFDCSLYE
ncbi:hypothetical protein PV10_02928 [Exophiala mesophila]|uniref:Protein kinase domain-containing protein n=1 Tax=Exophiala mesophila TaxID=212818 RepID=A0A0D1X0G5_EXOME|nr:uncharacterized protein PV10_02928 [Exophiala mesophila]KIV95255.1 hypothetical protein PV10_02928 [Exophiala mesophila]